MKMAAMTSAALGLLLLSGCGNTSSDNDSAALPGNGVVEEVWDFDNADGWEYFHQDTATVDQWAISDGMLALTTRANTYAVRRCIPPTVLLPMGCTGGVRMCLLLR